MPGRPMNSIRSFLPVGARRSWLSVVLGLCGVAAAQSVDDASTADRSPPAELLSFEVPIHEEVVAEGAAEEIWASRADYKVSFHDGIAFHPVLGASYPRNLPLMWRTDSVRLGARELAADLPTTTRSTDWRHEIHRGSVVEAYDVRADGLEQTFILTSPPAGSGDLVILGAVETYLHAAPFAAPAHREIEFCDDDGVPVVSYGAATVIDAAGRSLPVETDWDGTAIALRVPGTWLAAATYPVVVDPLLASALVLDGVDASRNPAVARSADAHLLVMDSRAVSASDFDTIGVMTRDAFTSPILVFSSVSSTLSTPQTRAAYVHAARQWCVAMEVRRSFLGRTLSSIGWHLRRPGDQVFRAVGNTMLLGGADTRPVVGGDAGGIFPGDNALIVFQRGSGPGSSIQGALIDCVNERLVTISQVSETAALRCEVPDVVEQVEMELDPWTVVWQEEGAGGRRQLRLGLVFNDGDTTDPVPVGHVNDLSVHDLAPRIDGQGAFCAIAFLSHPVTVSVSSDPVGPEILIHSLRRNHIAGSHLSYSTVALTTMRRGLNLAPRDVAFDFETQSHWVVVSHASFFGASVVFDRIGYDGESLEGGVVSGASAGGAATYSPRMHAYPIAYSESAALRGRMAAYPPVTSPTTYGASCGFATLRSDLTHAALPYSGHGRFALLLEPVSSALDGALLLGINALDVPLPGGCRLLVDPLVGIPFASSPQNDLAIRLPIPSAVAGVLFAQAYYVTRSGGQLGVTNGYRFEIVR